MKPSIHYRITDRINVTRPDQVCAYPRRISRRQTRHNPYIVTLPPPIEEKNIKIDEEKSIETSINEIKCELISNLNEDQVVIPNEFLQSNKIIKRQLTTNFTCQYCKEKFKSKNQYQFHLTKCQYESEQK
jgi:hypothetical protein